MYKKCELCERRCGIDRSAGKIGFCRTTDKIYVARADLHHWEEPPISGERGSGTVFFSGCSLGCIYCQNAEISRGEIGREVSEWELSKIFLELQEKGAHNINLVTATHYAPSVVSAVGKARAAGLKIPIVFNTGSYETPETLDMLRESVDIWLPDLKYYKTATAKEYSNAENLPKAARSAIDKMVSFARKPCFDSEGLMTRGVIVRILLLPSHLAEAKLNLKYLYDRYGDSIYISLMSQYTPMKRMKPPLNRRVTLAEYEELIAYAAKLGVKNAFVQERESASENFIPPFQI